MKFSISIIIPVKTYCLDLGHCLESLYLQTILPREILVVDNSPDSRLILKVIHLFKAKKMHIRYVREQVPGKAYARNKGIQMAKSKIIAFLDVDCVANKHWIEKITRSFESSKVKILVGKSHEQVVDITSLSTLVYTYFREVFKRLNQNMPIITHFDSKNCAIHHEVFKRGLRFNPQFFHSEDIAFGIMLLEKGFAIEYNKHMVVHHNLNKSFMNFIVDRFSAGFTYTILQNYLKKNYHKHLSHGKFSKQWKLLRTKFIQKVEKKVQKSFEERMLVPSQKYLFRCLLVIGKIIWNGGYIYGHIRHF